MGEKKGIAVPYLLRLSSFVVWFVSSPIAITRNLIKGKKSTVAEVV